MYFKMRDFTMQALIMVARETVLMFVFGLHSGLLLLLRYFYWVAADTSTSTRTYVD